MERHSVDDSATVTSIPSQFFQRIPWIFHSPSLTDRCLDRRRGSVWIVRKHWGVRLCSERRLTFQHSFFDPGLFLFLPNTLGPATHLDLQTYPVALTASETISPQR